MIISFLVTPGRNFDTSGEILTVSNELSKNKIKLIHLTLWSFEVSGFVISAGFFHSCSYLVCFCVVSSSQKLFYQKVILANHHASCPLYHHSHCVDFSYSGCKYCPISAPSQTGHPGLGPNFSFRL